MNEKVNVIKAKLINESLGQTIKYQFANELHKFRIEGEKTTHWLYIDRDYVDDTDKIILINMINIYGIVDTFKNSKKSKWLYLNDNGVREVDENFAKIDI